MTAAKKVVTRPAAGAAAATANVRGRRRRRRASSRGVTTVTGTTQLIGIIGRPVAHSLSPAIHNAAFVALGLDMVYVPLPVRDEDVGAAVKGLAALGFRGANVTIPHKGAVLPYLDRVDGDAALAEAVNTIVIEDGELLGYNTDVEGVHDALVEVCGDSLRGTPGLLLGAGGAARATALALARMGLDLTVVNRTSAAAERLAALTSAAVPGAVCRWLPLEELTVALVAEQHLLVNATSLGMDGASKVPASLADTVTAGQVVVDVVYGRSETDLLAQARVGGATVVGGLEMLLRQAAAAFKLWTGRSAPLDVMRYAAKQE
ncbi:MAG: shikimate dehydrogenase [Actinobacteria bacterium]|nr:shikimate dehydrogenase [Actinomycetota bacterium]